jgi:hypothetical protein
MNAQSTAAFDAYKKQFTSLPFYAQKAPCIMQLVAGNTNSMRV